MRLTALLLAAMLVPALATGQGQPSSSAPASASSAEDAQTLNLPVSLDRIRGALEQQPVPALRGLDAKPTFRLEIQERRRFEELLATLDFKSGPTPAGGVYAAEQQRLFWPSVDNPLRQPYAAFNQPELFTILIENLLGKYLAGHLLNALATAERERAEAAAREEARRAVSEFCVQQPNGGAGLRICSN